MKKKEKKEGGTRGERERGRARKEIIRSRLFAALDSYQQSAFGLIVFFRTAPSAVFSLVCSSFPFHTKQQIDLNPERK